MNMRVTGSYPAGLTSPVDKRIGDAFPIVEEVFRALPHLLYLAQNHEKYSAKQIELRANIAADAVEWRYEDGEWLVLATFNDLTRVDLSTIEENIQVSLDDATRLSEENRQYVETTLEIIRGIEDAIEGVEQSAISAAASANEDAVKAKDYAERAELAALSSDLTNLKVFQTLAEASSAAAMLPDGQSIEVVGSSRGNVLGGAYVIDSGSPVARLYDYTALRNYAGKELVVDITKQGLSGRFFLTGSTVAEDDGGVNIVDALGRVWVRLRSGRDVHVEWFGAPANGIDDDAPAFRLARDFLAANGGGNIMASARKYIFNSAEIRKGWSIKDPGGQVFEDVPAGVFLDEHIGIIGSGRSYTELKCVYSSVLNSVIILLDWKNAKSGGFTVKGIGASNNAYHGISTKSAVGYSSVLENVELFDVLVEDVGSYGIGNELQCRNVKLSGIATNNTGADGIDWKVRGHESIEGIVCDEVKFNNIVVKNYGLRSGAGSPSGIGIRGRVIMDGIEVYGASSTKPGIDFVAGTAINATQDYRASASNSTITNWYVEGADAKNDNIGIRIYASSAVNVGIGLAKWCKVRTEGSASTPYGFDDNGSVSNITVIPAHGRTGVEFTAAGSAAVGCRVISDKAYFDGKRGNLISGQSAFLLPWSSDIANSVLVIVLKNGVKLTSGVDYSLNGSELALSSSVAETDSIIVVMPPLRGFRIQADYCNLVACRQDRYIENYPSYSGQSSFDTGILSGFMWDGHKGVSEINHPTITGLQPQDPTYVDKDFRLLAKGLGTVMLGGSTNKVGFYSSSGAGKQSVTGSRGSNEALSSLLNALNTLGLISNNSTN